MSLLTRTLIIAALGVGLSPLRASAAAPPCRVDEGSDGLTLTGTSRKQTLILSVSGRTAVVRLDCDGDGSFTNAAAGDVEGEYSENRFTIDLKGNDLITIRESAFGVSHDLRILLGPGVNTLAFDQGGRAVEFGARLTLDVSGGVGADNIGLNFDGGLYDATLLLRVAAGAGNDTLNVTLPDSSGSRMDARLDLGAGTNRLTIGQQGRFESDADVEIEGGSGVDDVTFSPVRVDGKLRVRADLGAGNDRFTTRLDLAQLEVLGTLFVSVDGGPGNDVLSVTRDGTSSATGAVVSGVLDLRLSAGLGNDAITLDLGGRGLADFNGGTLRVRADGGAGADTLRVTLDTGVAGIIGPETYDVAMTAGAGNDLIVVEHDTPFPINYRQGAMIIDGGAGTLDRCTVAGGTVDRLHLLNCEL
jgi:hypothetical protein